MNTSSQIPTDLYTSLKGSLVAAEVLHTSSQTKDATLLQNIIYKLHTERKRYPAFERLISKVIFKIHDRVFYESSDFMRQSAHVATICGFAQAPTKNMTIAKELLNRMPLVEKPKNMLSSFQTILEQTTNLYADQGYQKQDSNRNVAYRLKALICMLAPFAKTQPEKQRIYDCANTLEKVQPTFKGFSQQYAFTPKKKSINVPILEPVNVYLRPVQSRRGFSFSRDD